MNILGIIIGSLIGAVVSGAVIWLVSTLNLGLKVDSFLWAMAAGLLIAVISSLLLSLLGSLGVAPTGFVGALVWLIVAAASITLSGSLLRGLRVAGYSGALVAALAIAVINWLASWLLGISGVIVGLIAVYLGVGIARLIAG